MKSNILAISAALAAFVVAVLLPISVTAAGIAATLVSIVAILCADYGRNLEPLRPELKAAEFDFAGRNQAELSEAA
jgi:membrane protein implicated in regulation of membrane protease activity